MARNDTVYTRLQRNGGFLTGRNHATLGTDDQMAQMKRNLAQKVAGQQGNNANGDPGDPSADNPDMPVKTGDEEEVVGGGEAAAPNYRPADGMSDCAGCMHFEQADGECERFEFTAKADHVCDDFKPQGDEENEDTDSGQ